VHRQQTDNMASIRNKRPLGHWVLIAVGFCCVSIAIISLAKFWLIPSIVRLKIEQALSKHINGSVTVDDVQVTYSKAMVVKGVKLLDKADRLWADARLITVKLANWPSLKPSVKEIEVDNINVRISSTDVNSILPTVRLPKPSAGTKRKLNLNKLTVKGLTISLGNEQVSEPVYDDLFFSAVRKDGSYEISVGRPASETSEFLVAKGMFNVETSEAELSIQIKHKVTEPEMRFALALLKAPESIRAHGDLNADLTINGFLKEPTSLLPKGKAELTNWTVAINENLLTEDLTTTLELSDGQIDVNDLTATLCKGKVDGAFYCTTKWNEPVEYSGQVFAQTINLPALSSIIADKKKAKKGTMTLSYRFTGVGKELQNIQGDGVMLLDDADTSVLPVIPDIFRAVGLSNFDPATLSDFEATFTNIGPTLTIKSAHIANQLAAVEAEPGGTINLQTEHIDVHVMAVPLNQLETLLKRMPGVDVLTNLRGRLIRLHIRGQWSQPPNKLIAKEPVKDIADATLGFLQDVVRNGGQFGQDMLSKFGALFKTKTNNKKNKNNKQ